MSGKMIDFDLFMKEKKREYITVKVFGKEYKVAREVPAIVPIMIARAGESEDASQLGLAMMRAGDAMFGKDAITEMCEQGISAQDLGALIRKVFGMVSGQDVDGEDTDEAMYDHMTGKVVADKRPKK